MAFALYSRGRYVGYVDPIHWYDEMAKAADKYNRKRRCKCTRGPHKSPHSQTKYLLSNGWLSSSFSGDKPELLDDPRCPLEIPGIRVGPC